MKKIKWTKEYKRKYHQEYNKKIDGKYVLGLCRKKIIQIKGSKCNDCGKKEVKFDIHHLDKTGISTVKNIKMVNNSLDNLIVLCRSCHLKRHPETTEKRILAIKKGTTKWSRNYTNCLECGTTEIKHRAYGYCEICWNK